MSATNEESRPTDRVLAWLSARGRASRPTVERACRALAERVDARIRGDRSPIHRYVGPLCRIGHVEEIPGGFAATPPTLSWARRSDLGMLLGARDGSLAAELRLRLGAGFAASHADGRWPETWTVSGDREAVASAIAPLEISVIDEPGPRLLASLPSLEEAIAAWPDFELSSAFAPWEVVEDTGRGRWRPAGGVWVGDGLVRSTGGGRRTWMVYRNCVGRLLDTPERRAVAWWAELARLSRPRLLFRRSTGRLVLPGSLLPPPSLAERPLIWASGSPPVRDAKMRLCYEGIDPERARELARILGLPLEDAS